MAKKRRMAYFRPELDADLQAMSNELKGSNVNEIVERACELVVQGWRRGQINDRGDLLYTVEVRKTGGVMAP